MKRYRRLIEPAAILLLVISAILPGWLSIAAGASALILLIALAASHLRVKRGWPWWWGWLRSFQWCSI